MSEITSPEPYAAALIHLLRGVVHADDGPIWSELCLYEIAIRQYFAQMGLSLERTDEYAFLRQPRSAEESVGGKMLPRLTRSYKLNYTATVLCAVLLEYLLDHEKKQNLELPVLTRDEIYELIRHFLNERGNEATVIQNVGGALDTLRQLGIVKFSTDTDDPRYEIRKVIKARITIDKLNEIRQWFAEAAPAPEGIGERDLDVDGGNDVGAL